MPTIHFDAFPLGAAHVARTETHVNDPLLGDSGTRRIVSVKNLAIVHIGGGPSMILSLDAIMTLRAKLIEILPLDDAFYEKHVVPRLKDRIAS